MGLILIVEDEDSVREILISLLANEHLCHTAGTVEQALIYLEIETYDLVLTDISMPGLSGVELLGHIRQRQPDTPVVIISGIDDEHSVKALINMGAFDYLSKPFQLNEVEQTVTRALEQRRVAMERHVSQPRAAAITEE